eukprot:m.69802 g.69802  ORF g.69802 m.69802 type:complete len:344 (+) comp24144_c1_seq1:107-1138(+)
MFMQLLILGAVVIGFSEAQSCIDNTGAEVDWWFTYKFNNGYNFAYADSTTSSFKIMPFGLDSSKAALIQTLQHMDPSKFQSANTTNKNLNDSASGYFLYNDEPDDGTASSSYGHTKGVIGMGSSSSFWILHSTPKFPPSKGTWEFPVTETIYGQTFLCMSLSTSSVNSIAGQFLYTEPYLYDNTVPATVSAKYPNLGLLFNKKFIHTAGTTTATFDVGGTSFTSLAKNKEWAQDLYEDLVAPTLGTDLIVESWIRGEALGPYCKTAYKHQVTDANSLAVGAISWTETQDHAKWCVPLAEVGPLCICDINRMESQRKRGGGCVCFNNKMLSTALRKTIVSYDKC